MQINEIRNKFSDTKYQESWSLESLLSWKTLKVFLNSSFLTRTKIYSKMLKLAQSFQKQFDIVGTLSLLETCIKKGIGSCQFFLEISGFWFIYSFSVELLFLLF